MRTLALHSKLPILPLQVLGADLAGTVLEADAASAFKPGAPEVERCTAGTSSAATP